MSGLFYKYYFIVLNQSSKYVRKQYLNQVLYNKTTSPYLWLTADSDYFNHSGTLDNDIYKLTD